MSGGIEFERGPLATQARKIVFLACWGFGVVGFVEVIGENDDGTGEGLFLFRLFGRFGKLLFGRCMLWSEVLSRRWWKLDLH